MYSANNRFQRPSRQRKISSRAIILAYLTIFPGYIGHNILKLYLSELDLPYGWLSISAAILLLPLLCCYVLTGETKLRSSVSEKSFFFFILAFLANVVVAYGSGTEALFVRQHLGAIVTLLVIYLLARMLPLGTPSRPSSYLLWSFVLSTLLVVSSRAFLLNTSEYGINYQGLALVYFVVAAFAVVYRPTVVRWTIYGVGIAGLGLLGARSEFATFFIFAGCYEFSMARIRRFVYLYGGVLGAVLLATPLGFEFVQTILGLFGQQRLAGLLNVTADNSWVERSSAFEEAILTIWDNPVFGDYGSYEKGSYAHNILSAWVDTGFLGFFSLSASMLLMSLALLRSLFAQLVLNLDRHHLTICLALAVSSVMLLCGAKYFTYPISALAIGLYGQLVTTRKLDRNVRRRRRTFQPVHSPPVEVGEMEVGRGE